MRKTNLTVAALLALALPFCAAAQQQAPPPPPQNPPSVAEAARKAREAKKTPAKPGKTYTNDNIDAVRGVVNVVGQEPAPATPPAGAQTPKPEGAAAEKSAPAKEEKGEAYWRKRFAEARHNLELAEKEADIMQRELNLLQVQFYSDPQKAMDEQLRRTELNDKQQKLDAKNKEVAQLKQAVADLELEMKRAGGDPGWARP